MKVGVVGLGLIGGSMAKAVKKKQIMKSSAGMLPKPSVTVQF